ncbi:MAG: phosphotransferase [Caldilineaceae bacterium]
MGAEGTHPAYVIEAQTAAGAALHLAVKCYHSAYGSTTLRAQREFKVLELLQKHAVPVPVPLYLDEEGTLLGTPSIVTTFVNGKQMLALPDVLAAARELAQVLAKIHSIPVGPAERKLLIEANQEMLWFRKTGVMPAYMANHPDGPLVWGAIERLLPTWQATPSTFVHTDYWIGQVLWEQGRISAVLDWEEAGYGDPAYDLAYCRMDLWIGAMGRPAADELLKVYAAEMGRPIANLDLWAFAATPRVMKNAQWEADCRQRLHDFIAEVRMSIGL